MPIWIKIVLFCWFGLTPVGLFMFRIWCTNHPIELMLDRYPTWLLAFALLIILDILAILPVAFWIVFLR